MDAAKAAIRYERVALAPVEQAPETDFVPLAERLTRYVGTDAWERRAQPDYSSGKKPVFKKNRR